MDNKTPELDESIKNALKAQSDSIIDNTGVDNKSASEDLVALYHSQYRNLFIWTTIKWAMSILTAIFCLYQFFQQESTMGMIAYATLFICCALAICTIYILLWTSMNKNAINRDLKRLVLQTVLLIKQIGLVTSQP